MGGEYLTTMKKEIKLKQRASENGRIILAHGEVTGHHHSFAIDAGVSWTIVVLIQIPISGRQNIQ